MNSLFARPENMLSVLLPNRDDTSHAVQGVKRGGGTAWEFVGVDIGRLRARETWNESCGKERKQKRRDALMTNHSDSRQIRSLFVSHLPHTYLWP